MVERGRLTKSFGDKATNVLEEENQDTKQAAKVLRRRKQRRGMHQAVD